MSTIENISEHDLIMPVLEQPVKTDDKVVNIDDYRSKSDTVNANRIFQHGAGILRAKHNRVITSDDVFQSVSEASQYLLDETFQLIVEVNDSELDIVERSNLFDMWKDNLRILSRNANHFLVSHNIILGSLINSTKKKDLNNFKVEVLKAFADATNALRKPRLQSQEVEPLMAQLSQLSCIPSTGLLNDGLSGLEEMNLDSIILKFIKDEDAK
jgi:hypothetical protein